MGKKLIRGYYKLFDEKLGSGVTVIFIITFLIASIGNIANANQNIEVNENNNIGEVIILNGRTYKLINE